MCGRYFFSLESDELKGYWDIVKEVANKQEIRIAHDEVFPSQNIIAITGDQDDDIHPSIYRWGFNGFRRGQLLINARSESVEEKRTFKSPFQQTRIVIPISGFYEWNSTKQKYLFTEDSEVMYLCGLSRNGTNSDHSLPEAVIMTTTPNQSIEDVHNRMPLILKWDDIHNWIYDISFARRFISDGVMPTLKRQPIKK